MTPVPPTNAVHPLPADLRYQAAVILAGILLHSRPETTLRAAQMAGTLSGGEQQMLMIGRALMAKPKLLMFDEPSLGLSPLLVQQVFQIIPRINAEGVPILLVEQNARMALQVSSYGYILENGEIALEGPADELAGDLQVQHAYLGA